jgi:hypothetical protein
MSTFLAHNHRMWPCAPSAPLRQGFYRLQSRFSRQLECDKEAFARAVDELKASDRADPIHFRRAFRSVAGRVLACVSAKQNRNPCGRARLLCA